VLCVSVLEHVGKDNRGYGAVQPTAENPRGEARRALTELARVVRPGGRILLTVPYGQRMDMGWFRQFDHDDLTNLLSAVSAKSTEMSVYQRGETGWQLGTPETAQNAVYRDGAYGVACVELVL
jgi:hypothetical protein